MALVKWRVSNTGRRSIYVAPELSAEFLRVLRGCFKSSLNCNRVSQQITETNRSEPDAVYLVMIVMIVSAGAAATPLFMGLLCDDISLDPHRAYQPNRLKSMYLLRSIFPCTSSVPSQLADTHSAIASSGVS